jgi:hypothetical protein
MIFWTNEKGVRVFWNNGGVALMVRIATFKYSDHEGPDDFETKNKIEQFLREETRPGE